MNLELLRELGEWMALGFYEGVELPWPRAYGLAFRSLYEHFEVLVPETGCLTPCEPLPRARNNATHGCWYATSLICDFDHNRGLRINGEIVEEKKARFPQLAGFIDQLTADLGYRLPYFCCSGCGYTHSNPDIRRIVNEGFLAMEAELDRQLAHTAPGGTVPPLLLALKDYTTGVRAFHGRTTAALRQAAQTAAGERKERLEQIAGAFEHCFLHPARTFVEGLLAVNFAWMLDGCDSIGRFDQALGKLYETDVAAGKLDVAFARGLLDEFWRNFERLNGWNLQLGGITPDGRDGANALTRECLAATERNRARRPNVALRISSRTPDDVLLQALRVLATGSGQALYNDDLYVRALRAMDLGLTEEDAREFGFGGCTETMIPGLSNVGSLEGWIDLAKALELALHDGFDPVAKSQCGPHTGRFEECADFVTFLGVLKRQIQFLTDEFVARSQLDLRQRAEHGDPKLYRTFFTRDCVKKGKSFEAGGARYNWAVVSYHGVANLIDGLAAVRECVYERKVVTAAGLLRALNANFAGHEPLRKTLLAAPKFGNDDPRADELGREILAFAWRELGLHETPRGGRYLPSCIEFVTYAMAGKSVGATPDGRKAGEALADSVGAVQGRDTHGPTALLNSVTRLPLTLAPGTPVLNLRFLKSFMQDEAKLPALAALIRTYFAQGGLQAQLSVVSQEELRAAQAEPEKHRDLIVRVGGYSEYFTALDADLQESVLQRTEHGW